MKFRTLKASCYSFALKHYWIIKPFFKALPDKYKNYLRKDFKYNIQPYLFERMLGKARLDSKFIFYDKDKHINNLTKNLAKGVNILSFPKGHFGLAQQAKTIGKSLEHMKVNSGYIDCGFLLPNTQKENEDNSVESQILKSNIYSCNLISFNPDQIMALYQSKGSRIFKKRYNIHYGAWELAQYPKPWIYATNLVHEFWAMSSFVQNAVEAVSTIPVLKMPYAIDFEIPHDITRDYFSFPKNIFLFMFSYDMSSLTNRKNPDAVIQAFLQAFPKEKEVGLVIKVSRDKNREDHNHEWKKLIQKASEDSRFFIIDKNLSNKDMKGLINLCDCYVSLHRAEGFGMGMAEAMKMGKAVIATNYSGNTDFTRPDTACVVDYKLIPIQPDEYVYYEKGQVWADANIEHAAHYMKMLYQDSVFYQKISTAGKKFIDSNYNHQIVGERFFSRLKLLGLL